jgi:hypothetical protein
MDVSQLAQAIKAALPGKAFKLLTGRAAGSPGSSTDVLAKFDDTLLAGEITTLDTAVLGHQTSFDPLLKVKLLKIAAIEARTQELISGGFEHPAASGDIYALDGASIDLIIGAYAGRAILPYPITWNTVDGVAEIEIDDATEMQSFFVSAMVAVKGHEDTGTLLKALVRAAVDITAVDAVVDNR